MSKKTGLKSVSQGGSEIHQIDPRIIKVRPNWNGRDFTDPANIEHVDSLAISIAEIPGVKEPLTVSWENGEVWLSDGECRLRAVLKVINSGVDIKTVPVKAEDRYSNDADKLFYQVLRNSGKPFSNMEQARVYKRLLDLGWQQNDIAKKVGVTPSRVSQVLDLLRLPEPIKEMLSKGQVSAGMAIAAINEHNPAKAVEVLKDAVAIAATQGRTRAMPKDNAEAKANIRTAMKDAFEFSDIDNNDDRFVIIKMPTDKFNMIKDLLKL